MVGRHDVEERVRGAAAVEDDFAIARRLDDDGPLRRAFGREQVSAIEGHASRVHIGKSVRLIEPRVNEDNIAGLHLALRQHAPIADERALICLHESSGGRLLALALIVRRIQVQHAPACRFPWLAACAHLHRFHRLALHAIRIREREAALIFRLRFEIENAARKPVRHRVIEISRRAEDVLATQAQQRQRGPPLFSARFAKRHRDRGIAIRIPRDVPLEAEIQQRRRLDAKRAGRDRIGGCREIRKCEGGDCQRNLHTNTSFTTFPNTSVRRQSRPA